MGADPYCLYGLLLLSVAIEERREEEEGNRLDRDGDSGGAAGLRGDLGGGAAAG